MKRKSKIVIRLLLPVLFSSCFSPLVILRAAPVDSLTAKGVAGKFFGQTYSLSTSECYISGAFAEKSSKGEAEYYIYNVTADETVESPQQRGFVIISAEDAAYPVIAYSTEGYYSSAHISPEFAFWMRRYKNQIESIRQHDLKATPDIENEWDTYKAKSTNQPAHSPDIGAVGVVAPLVKTSWAQAPYFNATCPDNCVAGCVATAMGQIMKYWAYPPHGISSDSYSDNPFGELSADFDTTRYDWSGMPLTVNRNNTQVATLMYDCGVSVNMSYTASSSGSYMISADNPPSGVSAQTAFVRYFGYQSSIQGLYMTNYTNGQWVSMLENELSNNRPFLYAGSGDSGSHAWVCDGYNSSGYFHMNWGWAGYEDGYFSLNDLNPGGYPLSSNEEALIGIQPAPAIADFHASPLVIWAGDTVRFTDNSFGYEQVTSHLWAFPGALTPSSETGNPLVIYDTPGTYDVSETVSSSGGSGVSALPDYIIVLDNNMVNVYPTLNDGSFTIQLHDASLVGSGLQFSLYNTLAERLYSVPLTQYITPTTVNLAHGVYFYRALDASGKEVSWGKLVIK